VGAGAGAAIGHKVGGSEGARIGMAYGGGAGSAVGGRGGLAAGVQRANKKGHFKPEPKGVSKAFTEPVGGSFQDVVSKVGDWKTIDQREVSQRRNRKTQRGAAAVGGTALSVGAATESLYHPSPTRSAIHNVKAIHRQDRTLRSLGKWVSPKDRAQFALRSAKAVPGPAKAVAGAAAVTAGALGVGAGARGVEAYHQRKINQRRRMHHSKVTKAFSEPVDKAFGGALFQGAAYAGKGIKSVLGATRGAGNAISNVGTKSIGSQMVKPGAHSAMPKLGLAGKTKIGGGLAMQKTGSAIAAHPGAALGATAGTAGVAGVGAGMGGKKR
jgi:hypothetical protein